MNIQIQALNLELTDAISDFVYNKFSKIERLVANADALCNIDLERTTNAQKQCDGDKVTVRIKTSKDLFQAENIDEDLYASIDLVKDTIERVIVNESSKKRSIFKKAAIRFKRLMKRNYEK
jgi:putative sigma-54 modulation protein